MQHGVVEERGLGLNPDVTVQGSCLTSVSSSIRRVLLNIHKYVPEHTS